MIRVMVAEDVRILRDALSAVLSMENDIEVVAEVAAGDHIVQAALRSQPDVAIVDIDLPGVDGITAAADLNRLIPGCRVLILTGLGRPGNLRRATVARVSGFLVKDSTAQDLIAAVRKIAAGGRVFDPELAVEALETPDNPLSPREVDVLRHHAEGAGSMEIAAAMYLSYGTVRNYLASAVRKLGARNRVDAVRIARESGWL
jgi:two-component system, NarL family, response regulator DesR